MDHFGYCCMAIGMALDGHALKSLGSMPHRAVTAHVMSLARLVGVVRRSLALQLTNLLPQFFDGLNQYGRHLAIVQTKV